MKTNARIASVVGSLLPLAFACTATAQANNADTSTTETDANSEPVYVLQPFVVDSSRDVGYVAVDSLAGGRIDTPLKLTPATVSSLTSAFIEDLNITDVRDALKWTPNVVADNPTAGKTASNAFHDWSFNFRGSGAGEQGGPGPTRNYFSFFQNPDTYNVERMEFLRGPNSLIFGIGSVGGTMNVYTKRPHLDSDLTTITGTMDSNGGMRATLDTNMVLRKNLAVRLNTVADNFQGWVNNDNGHFRAADLAIQYKPWESTWITVESEYGRRHRTLFGYTLPDEISGWDGVTASETWGATPTGTARTQAIQNAGAWGDWMTLFPVLIDGTIQYWAGGYASTSSLSDSTNDLYFQPYDGWYPDLVKKTWDTDYESTEDIPVLPGKDWTYGNGTSDIEYQDYTITLEQNINENMDLNVAAYYYRDDNTAKIYEATGGAAIDINKQLPDGTENPNYGKAFADFYLSKQHQWRRVTEMRAQLNYHFDATFLGSPMHQLFSMSTAYKKQQISARQYLGLDVPASEITNVNDWSQDLVWGRIYLDNPNAKLVIPDTVYWEQDPAGYWFDFDDTFKLKDVAAFSNTRLFNDSLSIQAGVRYDSYSEHLVEQRKNADLSDLVINEKDHGTTYAIGGIYYFHWLGAFMNYSENIQPPTAGMQSLLNNERPGPERGKGLEYGLRMSTDNHRYYASITHYNTKSTDHPVENPVALRSIWAAYYDANPSLTRDTNLVNLAYSDTTALYVKGWEYEITANPTDRIRLQASFAKPETSIGDYYPDARKYVSDHLSEWEAAVDAADTELHGEALQTAIDSIQNTLAQAIPGAIEAGMVRYTANMFAMYSFIKGDPLEGLSIGAGFSKTGRSYSAVYDDVKYWGDDTMTVNAVISYKTKLFGKDTRFALNVDNLLNNRDPIVTSYNWAYVDTEGKHIKDGYYLLNPRTFTFNVTVTF